VMRGMATGSTASHMGCQTPATCAAIDRHRTGGAHGSPPGDRRHVKLRLHKIVPAGWPVLVKFEWKNLTGRASRTGSPTA
jgi:hypothetical protein